MLISPSRLSVWEPCLLILAHRHQPSCPSPPVLPFLPMAASNTRYYAGISLVLKVTGAWPWGREGSKSVPRLTKSLTAQGIFYGQMPCTWQTQRMTNSSLNSFWYLYILGNALPLQENFGEGSMCQETLHGGLRQELDGSGHMTETAQEKGGVFHAVVADGIYLHYEHVFGYHLSRRKLECRPDSWTPSCVGDRN